MLYMLNNFWQTLDPVLFSCGIFTVRWYGLAYVAGFILAGVIVCFYAKRWKINFDSYHVCVFVCYIAIGIIICARLGYCIFYGNGYYWQNPLQILALNQGGMSFHGGMIGAILAGIAFAKVFDMPFMSLADLVACAVPVGLFFGRCANFVNGELYGAPTDLPWGVDFTGTGVMQHPSQLYEACLEGILLFIIMFILSRKNNPARPRGFFLGTFLLLYGIFRILIEFVRLPDVQIGYFFGSWGTMGQLLSLPMVIAGIIIIIWSLKRKLPQKGIGQH